MMRCLNTDQNKLYQQYSELSEELAEVASPYRNEQSLNKCIWNILSNVGFWRLSISKEHGGEGLSWQDCIVALNGFFNHYSDINFLATLMSQLSSLYLITRYGTESIKRRFLPRIIRGEMANLSISHQIHQLLNHHSLLSQKNKFHTEENNKILIHAEKVKEDIVFYITEKKLCATTDSDKSKKTILMEENVFIPKEIGRSALCDLLNFERLLYGLISKNYLNKIKNKYSVVS